MAANIGRQNTNETRNSNDTSKWTYKDTKSSYNGEVKAGLHLGSISATRV